MPICSDPPGQFRQIPAKIRCSPVFCSTKRYLGARNADGDRDVIPWPDYTSQINNELGLGEHFQGVQRLGQYLVLSGGIKSGRRRSQLVIVAMGTRPSVGPWALPEYGYSYKDPAPEDRIVTAVDIDHRRWHAGGIQAADRILAVPIYGDVAGSEIRFFDLTAPHAPVELERMRLHRRYIEAKAVGLTRLPDDHHVLVVWDDNRLDFHRSCTTTLRDGFSESYARVPRSACGHGFVAGDADPLEGTYQNINLLTGGDGSVYLVATRNSQRMSPTVPGADLVDLYLVRWPSGDFALPPMITLVDSKQVFCYNQQCNFGAGAAVYVDDSGHLYLYAVSHWLHGGNSRLNFNEYSY